jgi:hypothetical protein
MLSPHYPEAEKSIRRAKSTPIAATLPYPPADEYRG